MNNLIVINITVFLLAHLCSCINREDYLVKVDEVSPWCILDFDSLERTPKQRIAMLKEMGFTKYGYERGKERLDEMHMEFDLAKENGIEIHAIFLWLNAKRDSIGQLSPMNQELLRNLRTVEQRPTIWLSFSHNFFEGLSQEESLELSIKMIKFIKLQTDEIGCELALYNHHGWFGNPYNQIKILEELKQDSLSMVYNFHHAHEYLDEFPDIVKQMRPYLSHVNLNGVKKEGPQILTIGAGDYEYDMIKCLLDEGYDGSWGILGHIKTKDVQKVLQRNIDGLKSLNSRYLEEGK